MNLHKFLFLLSHNAYDRRFSTLFREMKEDQWKDDSTTVRDQEAQLKRLIGFCFDNVPYYSRLFKELGLKPEDVASVSDLQKLPVLTKDNIRENTEDFKPGNLDTIKYVNRATGGTTGTPMKYRTTKYERVLQWAIRFSRWGMGGYEPGDKVVVLGGSSLWPSQNSRLRALAFRVLRNFIFLSSFDMSDRNLESYISRINSFRPKAGYGYSSAWYVLAKYINKKRKTMDGPRSIFTTSEKLYPEVRKEIEKAFGCSVFDGYGLNDGGISAFECEEKAGLHIAPARSILEVVDDDGNQLREGEGRVLATSLYNFAMPLVRYETGDIASILPPEALCGCGRKSRRLKEIKGRSVDVFVTPDGETIHGWFFLYIFWDHCKGINKYQVVQETREEISINIVRGDDFEDSLLDTIREIIHNRCEKWNVAFNFVEDIPPTESGKYKFIISKIKGDAS